MNEVLPIRLVEKPWGRDALPQPFTRRGSGRIGEIWFEPPASLDSLLVKYLFTSEKLSVQVHPSDSQTLSAGIGRQGKEECWLVLDAEPGATLGIGFEMDLDSEAMRAAALDGSIEQMLTWHKVGPGDFFYIPANTVHAIGAGISLVEIQQNSDITYRLYDYGRPRELHLEEGVGVSQGKPYDMALHRKLDGDESASLVEGPYFRLDRLSGLPESELLSRYSGAPSLVIPLAGTVAAGELTVQPGECAQLDDISTAHFAEDGLVLITQPCG